MQRAGLPAVPDEKQIMRSTDTSLRWFKEIVTAAFGGAVLLCFFYLVVSALRYAGLDEKERPEYGHVKDLLLFINPLLGVVLGYYFGKIPAESRAEHAEAAAKTSSATAQTAVENARSAAEALEGAESKVQEVQSALRSVIGPAEALLSHGRSVDTNAGVAREEQINPSQVTQAELGAAIERAKLLLGQNS